MLGRGSPLMSRRSPWGKSGESVEGEAVVREEDVAAMITAEGDKVLWTQPTTLNGAEGTQTILYSDVATLLPGKSPNEAVVMWYALMIQRQAMQDPTWRRSRIFDAAFLPTWSAEHDITSVMRYIEGVNIFTEFEALLFPIRESDEHWTLIAATPKNVLEAMIMPINYHDPLSVFDVKVAKHVVSFLERARERLGLPRIVMNLRNVSLPQHFMDPTLIDCGVLLLSHMRSVVDGSTVGLDVARVRRMRFHAIQELLENHLILTPDF